MQFLANSLTLLILELLGLNAKNLHSVGFDGHARFHRRSPGPSRTCVGPVCRGTAHGLRFGAQK